MLPYYKKVERDMDFDGRCMARRAASPCGASSPSCGQRTPKPRPRPSKTAGFEYLPDQNGEWRDGYYPIAISNAYERRVSAAIGYLDPATRQRGNLHDLDRHAGGRAAVRGHSAASAWSAHVKGARHEFRAREVILSCGAIHSPAHLLRAGIGPVGHLKELGDRGACGAAPGSARA